MYVLTSIDRLISHYHASGGGPDGRADRGRGQPAVGDALRARVHGHERRLPRVRACMRRGGRGQPVNEKERTKLTRAPHPPPQVQALPGRLRALFDCRRPVRGDVRCVVDRLGLAHTNNCRSVWAGGAANERTQQQKQHDARGQHAGLPFVQLRLPTTVHALVQIVRPRLPGHEARGSRQISLSPVGRACGAHLEERERVQCSGLLVLFFLCVCVRVGKQDNTHSIIRAPLTHESRQTQQQRNQDKRLVHTKCGRRFLFVRSSRASSFFLSFLSLRKSAAAAPAPR